MRDRAGTRWLGMVAAGTATALCLAGCSSTVPGTPTAAPAVATAPSGSPTTATPSPTRSPSPTGGPTADPSIADTDYDVTAMCLFLTLGFVQVNGAYLDWQAATVAGTTPPVPTEDVAAAIDTAVTDSEQLVVDAPPGGAQDAGRAVLEEARALAAAMRAGGGTDPTTFGTAFDQLDAACPD